MALTRILVVDDEACIRTAIASWFTMRGFEVTEASSGTEAVRLCENNAFDAITMDLQMPGMSGEEAIAHIKTVRPEAHILVLTGYAQKTGAALENGAETILTKPIRMQTLEAEVRLLLEV